MKYEEYKHLIPKGFSHLAYYARGDFLKDITISEPIKNTEEDKTDKLLVPDEPVKKSRKKRGKQ